MDIEQRLADAEARIQRFEGTLSAIGVALAEVIKRLPDVEPHVAAALRYLEAESTATDPSDIRSEGLLDTAAMLLREHREPPASRT